MVLRPDGSSAANSDILDAPTAEVAVSLRPTPHSAGE
jgi:hypothetical protein